MLLKEAQALHPVLPATGRHVSRVANSSERDSDARPRTRFCPAMRRQRWPCGNIHGPVVIVADENHLHFIFFLGAIDPVAICIRSQLDLKRINLPLFAETSWSLPTLIMIMLWNCISFREHNVICQRAKITDLYSIIRMKRNIFLGKHKCWIMYTMWQTCFICVIENWRSNRKC